MLNLIQRVRADLDGAKRGAIERTADRMGIPRGTFRKIISGTTPNPRYSTVQKIAAYYARHRRAEPSAKRRMGRKSAKATPSP